MIRDRTARSTERGSAMVEAAIVFPVLVVIVMWSAAIADIMVLKLKAAEAARYALFETTVLHTGPQIDADVQARFVDLRSPASLNLSYTGLMMYPLAKDIAWLATVNTAASRVSLGGSARHVTGLPGLIGGFVDTVLGWITGSVDGAMRSQKFNTRGVASVRVTLQHARHDEQASSILKGGDLLGHKGGNDLDHSKGMTNYSFDAPLRSERPLQIVFDTWKAWPKPAAFTTDGAPTNVAVSPMQTYPTVEKQVSKQVEKIAFFGLTGQSWVTTLRDILNTISGAGISQTILGGRLPDVLSSDPMDGATTKNRGPITILPVDRADASFVPQTCAGPNGGTQPCQSSRVGDVFSNGQTLLNSNEAMGFGVDRTRFTVPYKINTSYWAQSGGTDNQSGNPDKVAKLTAPPLALTQKNEYVNAWNCRGHYFAGATAHGITVPSKRYGAACNK